MKYWNPSGALIGLSLFGSLENSAMAQDDTTATYAAVEDGARKERAKVLRDKADEEMKTGNYATACALYAESNDFVLDLQTEADLIECQVKLGLYADAHYRMLAAADKAKAIPDKEAWEWALKRAQEIKEEAPCIVVNVSEELRGIPDLEVSLDGGTIPRGSWNDVCVPVNLGTHQLHARATRRTWHQQRVTALNPRRHYAVTLTPPFLVEPTPPPQKMKSPIKLGAIAVPAALFLVAGLAPLIAIKHDGKDPTREIVSAAFLGGFMGVATSGVTVYATTADVPQVGPKQTTLVNIGVVYRGRF
ncbi:MAG TPA: hypothetical protein PK156_00455 [Polyangium sp.]|nr:hypothetical protein [Polyangium sp.]